MVDFTGAPIREAKFILDDRRSFKADERVNSNGVTWMFGPIDF